ncbi:MAG: acyltransferase domain-containing protein [Betaproteobacteria bacterium]
MAYALLFSGQANQHAGMLPWLESAPGAAPALRCMEALIGRDWRATLADPQRRGDNGFAQVLITGTALAAWAALQAAGALAPAVVAGYSVGELPAFAAAGALAPEASIALAQIRAQCMDQAAVDVRTGLLSVSGVARTRVLALCPDLAVAIDLGPEQGVYAGLDAYLATALLLLQAQGGQCQRLDVRLASHSPWMRQALDGFAAALDAVEWHAPQCPVALNASGALSRQTTALRSALAAQIASTVQWQACMQAVAERQPHCVLEIGAGAALARLWNARYPAIAARALDDFKDVSGALQWLEKNGAGD